MEKDCSKCGYGVKIATDYGCKCPISINKPCEKSKKTYKEWVDSKVCFSSFVKEGDVVDEAIVDYFVEVLPPVTMNFTMVQMGEPYDMVGGRNRYLTLEKVKNEWVYTGKKFRGGKLLLNF